MNLKKVYLNTLVPEIPYIINYNNKEFKRYLDLFYDEEKGILTVPLNTTGRVKGATADFVNISVDNLTVRNQFTNLHDNNTTADYDWYKMKIEPVHEPRDPHTSADFWPKERPEYRVIDVNKPYYKVNNEYPLILNNDNLSQIVGIFFEEDVIDGSLQILINPSTNSGGVKVIEMDKSYAGKGYVELVTIAYDASWGSTWDIYKNVPEGVNEVEIV